LSLPLATTEKSPVTSSVGFPVGAGVVGLFKKNIYIMENYFQNGRNKISKIRKRNKQN
jgi:hypothetical protein